MKLISFYRRNRSPGIGVTGFEDGRVLDLQAANSAAPHDMNAFLALGMEGLQIAWKAQETQKDNPSVWINPGDYVLRPPVPHPSKFLLMGLNYKAHVLEGGRELPERPVLFGRWAQSLIAHGEPIWVPQVSERVDWEGELVIVIGKEGKHIKPENALSHIGGYTCFNDVSIRDWQNMSTPAQWTLGKNFDHSGPLGPWLVTADDVPDPANLRLRTLVNGEVMQEGHTGDFIFDIPKLVALVSRAMTLYPGDLISTGTPGGVGNARKPPVYLKAGDEVTISIDGIGDLTNPVINEP